jgi:uncharacterized protein
MGFATYMRSAAAVLVLALLLGGPGAYAAEAKPDAQDKEATCQGVDMLDETKTRDPDLYRKIMAAAAATTNANALLWRVERPGHPASYLFGTVHLTDERVTHLSPAVDKALGESKTLALEVSDLSDTATASVIAQSAPLVMFTDGQRLDGMLTEQEYKTVEQIVERSGMPTDLAAQFKPWIITMILSVSECERTKVQQGERVLDMQLAELGKKRGMKIYGLETIPEQLKALAGVPQEQQLQMLRASLKFADRTNDLMETLVQLYLKRNIAAVMPFQIALARKVGIGDEAFAGFQQKLLVERNEKMRAAAEPLLDEGGVFIAVGALHLPGDKGLVSLLREIGYTVTPIE